MSETKAEGTFTETALSERELAEALDRARKARVDRAWERIKQILDEEGFDLRGAIAPIGGQPFRPTLEATLVLVPR